MDGMEIEHLSLEEFAAPPPIEEITGALPLPVGQIVRPTVLTDLEKATLAPLGVSEGQAIPADMAKRLEIARQEMKAAGQLEPTGNEFANIKPFVPPKEVDLSVLDDSHKADIMRALQDAQKVASIPDPGPEITNQVRPEQVIEVVDNVSDRKEESASGGDPSLAPSSCPHCGWDIATPDIPDPTEDDKLWYLQAILGNVRFEKAYSLLNGALEFEFREITIPQSDAIYAQVGRDLAGDDKATVEKFVELFRRYRLALQLKSIRRDKSLLVIPNDFDVSPGKIGDTLKLLSSVIASKVLTSITVANLAMQSMDRFNRLISKLEACAERENFWPAASQT
jgi:hypothetical protein